MNNWEVSERIARIRRAYEAERENADPVDLGMCDLCELFEATREETVEHERTGVPITVALCPDCWEKTDQYSRGEDVDFSDELRLLERGDHNE